VAPQGPIFRRLKLEDLDEAESFDAVVASSSLHHVGDLVLALERISTLLRPGGVLVLDEFGWDLFDRDTAGWYHGQRGDPGTVEDCLREWQDEHVGLHGYEDMRGELDRRFVERSFAWTPYLYRLVDGDATREVEEHLIRQGRIRAIGFRYVGTPAGGSVV
jgi:SAM-dependent methyltransferase